FLCVARERGWQAMGLEVSPAAAQEAAATSGVAVLQGELSRSLPAGVPPFDVLTMWDVVEHLSDPVGSLSHAHAWLRPGGMLVIQTQNANSVDSAWMRHRWEQFVEPHLYHFSPRTLRLALEKAGFDQIRIEASDSFPSSDPITHQAPIPRSTACRKSLGDCLRHIRDLLFMGLGYDLFTLMVAIARSPAGRGRPTA
ncbi:MAG TPA: class I SAM-dependent methyltransferase, partial [Candidatus Acidoferrum sp.]|nr:class I SAM-dependent methyltransferase [Candidatus Acidoferrum sp.]